MPRTPPPEGQITLGNAVKHLNEHGLHVSEGMIYKWVKAGRLKRYGPATRKQKFYMLRELNQILEEELAGAKRQKPAPVTLDWIHSGDLPAGIALAQRLYSEEVDLAEMAIYQGWRKNNPHLSLAAFSLDRAECFASIQLIPLIDEQIALDVLANRRTENSIRPDEIRTYDEPGSYVLLGTSAIVLPSRPELLLKLLRRYMEYWADMYPERYITKIYAQVVSESGDRLASSLFMAPRYDLAPNAYMLDMTRPGRAKIIHWFQEQLKAKAPLPLDLQWPPVQPHVQVTHAQATHAPPQRHIVPSELPEGTLTLNELAAELGVNRSTLYEQVRDNNLDHISIPLSELGKPGAGQERFFTPEQAQAVRNWRATRPKRKRESGDD